MRTEKAKEIIATNNGIKPLVELLKSKDLGSQKTAATALKNLAYQNGNYQFILILGHDIYSLFLDSNKLLIGKEGAIKLLVGMLKSTDEEAKLKAATTITVLAFKNGNIRIFDVNMPAILIFGSVTKNLLRAVTSH